MPRPEGSDIGTLNMMYGDKVTNEEGEVIGVKMPYADLMEMPSFEEHMDELRKKSMDELRRRAVADDENQTKGKAQKEEVEQAFMKNFGKTE